MDVRDTSITTYRENRKDHKLTMQQSLIVGAMRRYPQADFSLRELLKCTGIPDVSTVSARVNELKHKGILVEAKPRPCRITGRKVHPVKLKDRA